MLFVLVFITCGQTVFAAPAQPISLFVDATDISRGLFHSELAIPVQPGPLTLVYPKWIPGYHAPVGPLNNIVRLKISHNGQPIEWTRDPVDMFAFHLVVPVGVSVLHVAMDVVAPRRPNADLGASTARLFVLEWNEVVLYPQGAATDKVLTRAQIRLPLGWKFACSMSPIRTENGVVEFRQVSLTTLVDSPLLSGEYFRTLALTSTPPVFVDIAADVPGALDVTLEWEAWLRRLIAEARALFGGFHFDQYRFLLALSDELGNDGIEHQQSSDNRVGARLFCDEALRLSYGYLLPHEFVHSWNGKYRRPLGLAKRNFQEPQVGDLLWVYEGLTRYLNWVLAARSGIFTPQEARDYVALLAALMDHRSGREWRTLEDTAVSAQLLYGAPEQWQSLRRSMDYYDESLLIWLEADTIIRQKTQGQRSLDDFCRAFFGPQSVPVATDPYVLGDVTTALAVVAPYDWKTFFVTRLNASGTDRVPLEGLTSSGWTLAYGDSAGSVQAARDEIHRTVEERFSLGFLSQEDGTVLDVVRDSPAWKAGLGPGMKLLTVNQRRWSPQVFRDAIAADHNSSIPINLSVQNGLVTFPVAINDHTGASYPRLERNANPDLISEILRPRITTGATP
jgi:predicted metalloprotease with PDZ domain